MSHRHTIANLISNHWIKHGIRKVTTLLLQTFKKRIIVNKFTCNIRATRCRKWNGINLASRTQRGMHSRCTVTAACHAQQEKDAGAMATQRQTTLGCHYASVFCLQAGPSKKRRKNKSELTLILLPSVTVPLRCDETPVTNQIRRDL